MAAHEIKGKREAAFTTFLAALAALAVLLLLAS